MKTLIKISLIILVNTFVFSTCIAETSNGNGLEVKDYTKLRVVIENIQNNHSFTVDIIRSKVENLLRQNGIRPLPLEVPSTPTQEELLLYDHFLYVNISCLELPNGATVSDVKLSFTRTINYSIESKTFSCLGTTWFNGTLITSMNNDEYIIRGLEQYVNLFISEFLKANGK